MINIGLIGCGRISEKHFEAITLQGDARCVACCDIVNERAHEAAEKYNIPFWTNNYKDMLQQNNIDLISICTPSGLHPEHGILAALHGKHVLSEKPMAVRLKDADELIKACDQAGVKLFVVLQNRLNPAIQLIRQAFNDGRFGRIFMIVANIFWTRSQEYYDMAPWRGTWALDGGAFMNQATHYVDMLRWFGGPVESVQALMATLARNIEAEDTGSAIIRFKSKAVGSINVTMLTYPRNLEGSITIIGKTGTVKVGGIAMNKIEHWEFADRRDYDQKVQMASRNPDSVYGSGHIGYYSSVIKALMNESESDEMLTALPPVNGLEGSRALQILEVIYKASKQKAPVLIDIEP